MSRNGSPGHRTPHPLEWSVGAASAVLVAALIGAVLYQAIEAGPRVPELSATVDSIDATAAGRFRVRFTAVNVGDATAAAVEIVGTLSDPSAQIELERVTLDYVPAHSSAGGWLIFDRDPRLRNVVLHVSPRGYAEP